MLTDTQCRTAKPKEKLYRLNDSNGLYLEVKPNGKKAWRYRFKLSGKSSMFALGESLQLAIFERVELIGHSFGGYLAQCLAAMCPEKVSQLWLLSALTSEGGSAYQQSGQNDMMSVCKLDLAQGRIALHSAERFHHLLGGDIPLAGSEPAQLLLDLPPSSITDLSCPVNYLITEQDRLTSVSHQLKFAGRLEARVIYWSGGHIAPLSDIRWLSKGIY